jgi:RNA polymerase sigma-70 factor (ECF subfamily)
MNIALSFEGEERKLIEACVQRERWAQRVVYEAYYGPMMGVCLRYSSNREEAEDTLHEAFIKVFKSIDKYKPGTSLTSWIRRIVVNTAIDQYRKRSRRRTEDIDHAYDVSSENPGAISMVTEKEILKCVQCLTPTYRNVFNLYVMEGYSHREVGERLGISESTSRSNLVKARAKLREMLKEKGIINE